jgi:hypothetical protein
MSHRTAAWLVTGTRHLAERVRRADAEQGQGTVEYAGLPIRREVAPNARTVGNGVGRHPSRSWQRPGSTGECAGGGHVGDCARWRPL